MNTSLIKEIDHSYEKILQELTNSPIEEIIKNRINNIEKITALRSELPSENNEVDTHEKYFIIRELHNNRQQSIIESAGFVYDMLPTKSSYYEAISSWLDDKISDEIIAKTNQDIDKIILSLCESHEFFITNYANICDSRIPLVCNEFSKSLQTLLKFYHKTISYNEELINRANNIIGQIDNMYMQSSRNFIEDNKNKLHTMICGKKFIVHTLTIGKDIDKFVDECIESCMNFLKNVHEIVVNEFVEITKKELHIALKRLPMFDEYGANKFNYYQNALTCLDSSYVHDVIKILIHINNIASICGQSLELDDIKKSPQLNTGIEDFNLILHHIPFVHSEHPSKQKMFKQLINIILLTVSLQPDYFYYHMKFNLNCQDTGDSTFSNHSFDKETHIFGLKCTELCVTPIIDENICSNEFSAPNKMMTISEYKQKLAINKSNHFLTLNSCAFDQHFLKFSQYVYDYINFQSGICYCSNFVLANGCDENPYRQHLDQSPHDNKFIKYAVDSYCIQSSIFNKYNKCYMDVLSNTYEFSIPEPQCAQMLKNICTQLANMKIKMTFDNLVKKISRSGTIVFDSDNMFDKLISEKFYDLSDIVFNDESLSYRMYRLN